MLGGASLPATLSSLLGWLMKGATSQWSGGSCPEHMPRMPFPFQTRVCSRWRCCTYPMPNIILARLYFWGKMINPFRPMYLTLLKSYFQASPCPLPRLMQCSPAGITSLLVGGRSVLLTEALSVAERELMGHHAPLWPLTKVLDIGGMARKPRYSDPVKSATGEGGLDTASHVTYSVGHVTCSVSHVTCSVSHVTCSVSHVTRSASHVTRSASGLSCI